MLHQCGNVVWLVSLSTCFLGLFFGDILYNFSANDDPHGVFKLQQGAQKLQVSGNNRQLQFTVLREKGKFGAVDVQYEVRHSEWYPTQLKGSVTVPDQQSQVKK